jgi:hypothetical protein
MVESASNQAAFGDRPYLPKIRFPMDKDDDNDDDDKLGAALKATLNQEQVERTEERERGVKREKERESE